MADLTDADLAQFAKLPADQQAVLRPKLTAGERARLNAQSPTYVPPEASGQSATSTQEFLRYLKELATGEGPGRTQALDYGKRELAGFAGAFNPIAAARGIVNGGLMLGGPRAAVRNPTGSALLAGDPNAVGAALSVPVAARLPVAARTGMRTAGEALATSDRLQNAVNLAGGSVTGALGAKSVGISPFIGGIIGRNLFKGSTGPATLGEFLQRLGGGTPARSLSDVALAEREVAAGRLDPSLLEAIRRGAAKPANPPQVPGLLPKPSGEAVLRSQLTPFGEGGIMPEAMRPAELDPRISGLSPPVTPPNMAPPLNVKAAQEAAAQAFMDRMGGTAKPAAEQAGAPQAIQSAAAKRAARYLRDEFGSTQASREAFGNKRPGDTLPSRKEMAAWITDYAPGESQLPNVAKDALDAHVEALLRAPNDLARRYVIEQLQARMKKP